MGCDTHTGARTAVSQLHQLSSLRSLRRRQQRGRGQAREASHGGALLSGSLALGSGRVALHRVQLAEEGGADVEGDPAENRGEEAQEQQRA